MIMGGRRGCGKTTELIKVANEKGMYIVCASRQRAKYVADLDIPYPISVDELPIRSQFIKEVLVDDIEDVLSALIRKPIYQATSSLELRNL
jgi:hypothetical protein